MKRFIASLILITCLHATAQVPALYNNISTSVQTIHSKILNQQRQIYLYKPALDSSDADNTLPVLYLLDGENHFNIVASYINYLSRWKVIPKIIVVGIINTDRRKDLTPTNNLISFDGKVDSSYKTTGGNQQFFKFIQQELMPYVQANYKPGPYKILAGHSFGGITAINCMLTQPEMFDAYIAVSPSLWWHNKYVLQLTAQKLQHLSALNKKFFYSTGNEGGGFRNDVQALDSIVTNSKLPGFAFKYIDYPNESHMTEPIPAYYDALKFIYKNWADSVKKE